MTFVETILHKMPQLSKPRFSFLIALFGALSCFVGRATMVNLSRFGAGSPRRLHRWFERPFDWPTLNWTALEQTEATDHLLTICVDCTFLPKSGSHTWGFASFHNGATGRSEPGCEACVVGLLDLDEQTAYTLEAHQTPAGFDDEDLTRSDFYLECILAQRDDLIAHSIRHVVGDGFFAKTKFIEGLVEAGLELVSKLRCDANMRYLYTGPRTSGRGRPKLYDGKVDWEELSRFERLSDPADGVELYWADLNSPHFGRNLRVVVVVQEHKGKRRRTLLFTTDMELEPIWVYRMYKARFQQEFIFRDGKQFMGLADGQMRDQVKRHEHLNASLSALNLLRLEDRAEQKDANHRVISMASWKRRKYAQYQAQRMCAYLDLTPEQKKKLADPGAPAYLRQIAS